MRRASRQRTGHRSSAFESSFPRAWIYPRPSHVPPFHLPRLRIPIVFAGTVTSTTSLQRTPFFTKMRTGALYRGRRILAGKP
jgi:hypothetical protein